MSSAGRVDTAGEVPQLDDGLLGSAVSVVHELRHLIEIEVVGVGQFLLDHAQTHGDGDQLGLGPVVEVPFDPSQGGSGRVDGLGTGIFEGAHPAAMASGPEQGPHQVPVDVEHDPDRPMGPGRKETPVQKMAARGRTRIVDERYPGATSAGTMPKTAGWHRATQG